MFLISWPKINFQSPPRACLSSLAPEIREKWLWPLYFAKCWPGAIMESVSLSTFQAYLPASSRLSAWMRERRRNWGTLQACGVRSSCKRTSPGMVSPGFAPPPNPIGEAPGRKEQKENTGRKEGKRMYQRGPPGHDRGYVRRGLGGQGWCVGVCCMLAGGWWGEGADFTHSYCC